MAHTRLDLMMRHLRRWAGGADTPEMSDGELLEQFLTRRDETYFTSLVQRHAPLVWNVCRGLLSTDADAEDAFQATFLVLVHRAASLHRHGPLTGWLAEVARRTALKLRRDSGRRSLGDRQVPVVRNEADTVVDELARKELERLIHEEVHGLPPKDRLPLLLCWLLGRTHEEAARELGVPRGSMAKRLAGAQARLRRRLMARGVTLSLCGIVALLGEGSCSPLLAAATVQAAVRLTAGETASVSVLSLVEGVVRAMTVTRVRNAMVVLVVFGLMGTAGAGLWSQIGGGHPAEIAASEPPLPPENPPPSESEPDEEVLAPPAPPLPLPKDDVRERLEQPVKFKGFDADPKMTLQEGLEHLADRYGLTFDTDGKAFTREHPNADDVLSAIIADQTIPKMDNVPLSVVLDKILDRVKPPATYRVCHGVIKIIPFKHTQLDDLVADNREFVPTVSVQFHGLSVAEALDLVAEQTGINIVVDCRGLGKAEKMAATAKLTRVPVDTAVKMLADMADLKPVVLEGAIYVTSKANADTLQQERDKKRQQRQEREKREEA